MRFTSFQKRILSALVLGPIVFAIIWHGGWIFMIFVLACAALALSEWIALAFKTDHKYWFTLLGVIYIALGFASCYSIRTFINAEAALVFILMVWASDIGAYAFGKAIGGPKLAVKISPNKTWAGLAGAIISPNLVLLIHGVLTSSLWVLVCGIVVGCSGQAGDLLVSVLKRRANAKDSGQLIPGHGGFLDRVDSLILAAPAFFLLFVIALFSVKDH